MHTGARRGIRSGAPLLPGTNVVETTFTTDRGVVRVTDALTLPDAGLTPVRELQRRVEGLSGNVPVRWGVVPGFGYGSRAPRISGRAGVPVASAGANALAVCTWEAGEPQCTHGAINGGFEARPGSRALIALCFAHQDPLVFPTRA